MSLRFESSSNPKNLASTKEPSRLWRKLKRISVVIGNFLDFRCDNIRRADSITFCGRVWFVDDWKPARSCAGEVEA